MEWYTTFKNKINYELIDNINLSFNLNNILNISKIKNIIIPFNDNLKNKIY